MVTPEHVETWMHLAGDLINKADQVAYCLKIKSLFPWIECVLKGQFTSTEEVTAKALTEIKKNNFQEGFQKLYERWQKCVTDQGKYAEGNFV
jgi:hypothetical protein